MTKYYEAILPPPNFILDWVEGGGDDYSQAGDKLFFSKKKTVILFGNITLPIVGESNTFRFGCWVEIEADLFFSMQDQTGDRYCKAILRSSLPFYKGSENSFVECHFDTSIENFKTPNINLEKSNQEIFFHQKNGIPQNVFIEWMNILS
jgi:hypothetical protein